MSNRLDHYNNQMSCHARCASLMLALVPLLTGVVAGAEQDVEPTSQQLEFFESKVRPVLAEHCYSCHSTRAKKLQAGLLVDSRQGLIQGGDSGESIIPGDPDSSLLMEAVRYESYEMPPKGKLPDSDIAALEKWIRMGSPWPKEDAPEAAVNRPQFDLQQRRQEHWMWQPVQDPEPPQVTDEVWPRAELDYFVLSGLEDQDLKPAEDADRNAVFRRLYMDLIGLPPTMEQVAEFESDRSENAIERVVDQLLASPRFGERWGRHWLDLVRYAESRGHEFDNDIPNAFQYRDYVIRALNADVPYDQFVREQIAGDLLSQPRLNPDEQFNESVLGTGFWYLGEWVHSPVDIRKDEADRFDNMIDVMSKTFLGVTVACARCHDHKFDAISTADYYALTGFLQSSDYRQVRFESIEHNRAVAQNLTALDTAYQQQIQEFLSGHGITPPAAPEPLSDSSIIVDYGNMSSADYLQDGYTFGAAPRRAGLAYLRPDQPAVDVAVYSAAQNDLFWKGLESITEGHVQTLSDLVKVPRSGRTLRTPTFELQHGDVACRVNGTGHVVACVDSHRMVHGPLHRKTIRRVRDADGWVRLDLKAYVGHCLHLEFVPARGQNLSVRLAVQGLDVHQRGELDETLADRDRQYEEYADAAERLLNGDSSDSTSETTARAQADAQSILANWTAARQQLRAQVMLKSRVAPAMLDGSGEDEHILIRGNAAKPGNTEPRHFLTAITGNDPMSIAIGSGRLELADHINDPANPLTARVIVNRIWHYLMGRGIVASTDDFGVLGQRPTHPELLDHLATRFQQDGRSVKNMIRYIALSRTYQMSSQFDDNAMEADPKNLLWHHRPPKRLEGETIRDSLLVLSGQLDMSLYGPPVPIHLTSFMDGRGRPKKSGPLDGDGRRSIYVAVRRNFLSPFMLAFDTPVPFSTMGRRNQSNVPSQALILMNDPFVVDQARSWSKRAMDSSDSDADRIRWMYATAFARQPGDEELQVALDFVGAHPDEHTWADFAHALINTKEFIFLR